MCFSHRIPSSWVFPLSNYNDLYDLGDTRSEKEEVNRYKKFRVGDVVYSEHAPKFIFKITELDIDLGLLKIQYQNGVEIYTLISILNSCKLCKFQVTPLYELLNGKRDI